MNELQRFLQEQMDARGWKQADLVHHSKLSRAHVSKIMTSDAQVLDQLPDRATMEKIATGLTVPFEVVLVAAVRALGVPPAALPLTIPSAEGLTNEQLLAELSRRLDQREPSMTPAERRLHAAHERSDGPKRGKSRNA